MEKMVERGNFLLDTARKVAEMEIRQGKSSFLAPITTWGDGKTLWVATDENDIFATQVFLVDEHEVFIGTRKN